MRQLSSAAQPDYLSGLLIGHEIAGPIAPAGDDDLCRRYQRALAAFGHARAAIVSGTTERGLWRVARSAVLVLRSAAC